LLAVISYPAQHVTVQIQNAMFLTGASTNPLRSPVSSAPRINSVSDLHVTGCVLLIRCGRE